MPSSSPSHRQLEVLQLIQQRVESCCHVRLGPHAQLQQHKQTHGLKHAAMAATIRRGAPHSGRGGGAA